MTIVAVLRQSVHLFFIPGNGFEDFIQALPYLFTEKVSLAFPEDHFIRYRSGSFSSVIPSSQKRIVYVFPHRLNTFTFGNKARVQGAEFIFKPAFVFHLFRVNRHFRNDFRFQHQLRCLHNLIHNKTVEFLPLFVALRTQRQIHKVIYRL